jgi:hypothetical protein
VKRFAVNHVIKQLSQSQRRVVHLHFLAIRINLNAKELLSLATTLYIFLSLTIISLLKESLENRSFKQAVHLSGKS